jgi:hypothetical protein
MFWFQGGVIGLNLSLFWTNLPMLVLERNQPACSTIKYNVIPNDQGVMLCIWEPAQVSKDRAKPFLYMVKHQLLSETMVPGVLSQYAQIQSGQPFQPNRTAL